MKATRVMLFAGAAALLAAGLVFAAPQAVKDHASRFANALQLTEQQKAQIQPIREKYRTQFRQLREREQNEISRILTPAQREKMQQLRQQRMGQGGWGHGRMMAGRRGMLGRVAQQLNLTADQRQKVKQVIASHRTDFQNLRQQAKAPGADRAQIRQQAHALRDKVVAEVRPILTNDQWSKLQSLMQQHMGQRKQG